MTPPTFERTITTWSDFTQNWGGVHNFLLAGDITADFDYELPPLERIVEEVRAHDQSHFRRGVKQDEFDLTDIKEEFRKLPMAEALKRPFVLAHFRKLHPNLTGKGQVFDGLDERWTEPWRRKLLEKGFTFDCIYAIVFISGPNSASNYHMDTTHQLAWQRYGTKYFNGLRDPNRWTTVDQRASCALPGSVKPKEITPADTYTIVQPAGTVLWNAVATPHWVETFDQPAATLTLVHQGLRYKGKLCPLAEEAAAHAARLVAQNKQPQEAARAY